MSELLRGVALVDAVMAQRRENGEALTPCPPAELATRRLGDRALTPALRRWLEHDAGYFTLGEPMSFMEIVDSELYEFRDGFTSAAALLTEPCVLFEGWGADSLRLIYLGQTDAAGEYPVITLDVDDTPYAVINGPVDMWLAQQAGFLEEETVYGHVPPLYAPARDEHARLSFGGVIDFDCNEPERRVQARK